MADFSQGEERLLIDGKLTTARFGGTYENLNPATEEVIGRVADADAGDMDAAIGAARRAYDETDWSSNHKLRERCLTQFQEALEKHRDDLRMQTVAEVGSPIALTYGPQGDSVISDLKWPTSVISQYAWQYELPVHEFFGSRSRRNCSERL